MHKAKELFGESFCNLFELMMADCLKRYDASKIFNCSWQEVLIEDSEDIIEKFKLQNLRWPISIQNCFHKNNSNELSDYLFFDTRLNLYYKIIKNGSEYLLVEHSKIFVSDEFKNVLKEI